MKEAERWEEKKLRLFLNTTFGLDGKAEWWRNPTLTNLSRAERIKVFEEIK